MCKLDTSGPTDYMTPCGLFPFQQYLSNIKTANHKKCRGHGFKKAKQY